MKLLKKIRKGSRLIRRYDPPRTPWERARDSKEALSERVGALQMALKRTDPFKLSQRIDKRLQHLFQLAGLRGGPCLISVGPASNGHRPLKKRAHTPWRGWTFSRRLKQQEQEMRRQMHQGLSLPDLSSHE